MNQFNKFIHFSQLSIDFQFKNKFFWQTDFYSKILKLSSIQGIKFKKNFMIESFVF